MSHHRIAEGRLARAGLLDAETVAVAEALLDEIEARGLETIRLSFADQHGQLRGKTLTPAALAGAFRSGLAMTSTLLLKDTSHRTVFDVWGEGAGLGGGRLEGAGDVLVVPDPASFRLLPQSPHSGWLIGDLAFKDLSPLPFCPRSILRRAAAALAADGMAMRAGLEVEFHLLRLADDRLTHEAAGWPAEPPATAPSHHGYQYLTEASYAALEPVLDAIRRALQALGLPLRSVEVEFGPSQVELTFEPAAPLAQADAMVLMRANVRETARRHGFHASFMCRPRLPHALPSGWHLHQSLTDTRTGANLFRSPDGALTPAASGCIAGLLEHAAASCLLSTPTVNGYKRYKPFQLAPDRIQWARDNKGAMIRALIGPDDPAARIENRVAEPAANPYLFLAAQIEAGRDGIARGLAAPSPAEHPYATEAPRLPASLGEAIEAFAAAPLWRQRWGAEVVDWLARIKRAEWSRYLAHVSDWEEAEYFRQF